MANKSGSAATFKDVLVGAKSAGTVHFSKSRNRRLSESATKLMPEFRVKAKTPKKGW